METSNDYVSLINYKSFPDLLAPWIRKKYAPTYGVWNPIHQEYDEVNQFNFTLSIKTMRDTKQYNLPAFFECTNHTLLYLLLPRDMNYDYFVVRLSIDIKKRIPTKDSRIFRITDPDIISISQVHSYDLWKNDLFCDRAVKHNPFNIRYVDRSLHYRFALEAVQRNPIAFLFVSDPEPLVIVTALQLDPSLSWAVLQSEKNDYQFPSPKYSLNPKAKVFRKTP